ncbi:MAG: PTS system mannose/fructose/sorbose family transporter subunit IID [Culicoidibacterales bacterium]
MESKKYILTKRDLNQLGFRSIIYLNSSFNYQKMQAAGWTNAMAPTLEKIYGDDKAALAAALQDNMEFINTNTNLSSFLMGLLISLEEKKEERSLIEGLKVGLFAPLAGIGDAIFWFTLLPIVAGLCASFAVEGNIIGPILFFVIYIAVAMFRLSFVHLGYKLGLSAIEKISAHSALVAKAATILGCTVIGGLIASYVKLPVLLEFKIAAEETLSVQEAFLDKIFPGLLPISLTFLLYYLLKKKNANPVILIFGLLVFALVGSWLGVL